MLAGKWISKMFEPNKQITIDYERLSYEFSCDLHYEDLFRIIEKFFYEVCKTPTYTYLGEGKFNLYLHFSMIEKINMNLHFYKINEKKLIFSIAYKDGNQLNYARFMKDFCEENTSNFKFF
jgi:hypothetical protein